MSHRFETRDIAEKVLGEFHNVVSKDGVKLLLRFADTKAQKLLKQQSNERRAYRAGEYNYSVEVVQGSTPSPSLHRIQQGVSHISPNSQASYASPVGVSPVGVGSTWTPATSISPSYVTECLCSLPRHADDTSRYPLMKSQAGNVRFNSWSSKGGPRALENTPLGRGQRNAWTDNVSGGSSKMNFPATPCVKTRSEQSSPRKSNVKAGSVSPISARKEVIVTSPRSVI